MQNDLFDGIEVPKAEVVHAIQQGIAKGKNVQKHRKNKRITKKFSILGTVAVAAFLVSGLVITPIGNALAQVPFIGEYYQKFHMSIGEEMASEQLITEMNESVTNNGVTMNITSAFYDGHFLGITFKATGENLSEEINGDFGPESGYTFDLFTQGDDSGGFGGDLSPLVKEGDSYIGAIIFDNDQVKNLTTLPITFTYMGGVLGEWKFNVPIETLPSKSITLQQKSTSKNEDYVVQFTEATINKASVIVNFDIQKEAGIEGEHLLFRTKIKSTNGYAAIVSENNHSLTIEKDIDTEKIILEPYFKINEKEIDLTSIEINLK